VSGLLRRWRKFYGANPLHLLALLASLAIAGYAAYRASLGPLPVRMAVWFLAAVVAHDLVLFPLYALADRTLVGAVRHRATRRTTPPVPVLNYVRVPALLSGLLFVVFSPVILRLSVPSYRAASGLDQDPYLSRWLLLTAALFLASALAYAARLGRARARSR